MGSSHLSFPNPAGKQRGEKGRHCGWGSWGRNPSQIARPRFLLWNRNTVKGSKPLLELLSSNVVINFELLCRVNNSPGKKLSLHSRATFAIKFQLKSWLSLAGLSPHCAISVTSSITHSHTSKATASHGRTLIFSRKDWWEPRESRIIWLESMGKELRWTNLWVCDIWTIFSKSVIHLVITWMTIAYYPCDKESKCTNYLIPKTWMSTQWYRYRKM
jgi:hypothetical protein